MSSRQEKRPASPQDDSQSEAKKCKGGRRPGVTDTLVKPFKSDDPLRNKWATDNMEKVEKKLHNINYRSEADFVFAWYDSKTGTSKILSSPSLAAFWDLTCSQVPFRVLAKTLSDYHYTVNLVSSGQQGKPMDFKKFAKTITEPIDFITLERKVKVELVRNLIDLAIPQRADKYPYETTSHATLASGTHPVALVPFNFWDPEIDYKRPSRMSDDELMVIFKSAYRFCASWDAHLATRYIADTCKLLGGQEVMCDSGDTSLSHYGRLTIAARLLLSVMPGMFLLFISAGPVVPVGPVVHVPVTSHQYISLIGLCRDCSAHPSGNGS